MTKMPGCDSADGKRIGLASHTDFGSITVLFNWVGGLQIQSHDPERQGEWAFVKPLPGHAIINLGDAMVKFSNGRLKSGKHRVVPLPGPPGQLDRYSLVYFVRPADDVLLEPVEQYKDEPVVTVGGKLNGSDEAAWSRVTLSYSASDIHTVESGTAGFGFWSLGGAELHEDLHREMASCDVSISFSALIVDIHRPWLHSELFSDTDLEVQRGVKVSPGPSRIHEMMKDREDEKSSEWAFPAYPTSFVIAADTMVEFKGEAKAIEEFWRAGGEVVGYGPWSVSGSAAAEQARFESTSTGCKISFGVPQIIGWANQTVPSMPRS
ncbi:hypothetical protein H9Q69_014099 [Fusarium xylarioides]|nr:hypothetical protein H9Q69_014099 [Fusarium xylarioides]